MTLELSEQSGFWWLATNADPVSGRLSQLSDLTVQLELLAASDLKQELLGEEEQAVIFGTTTEGKRVTLLDCQFVGRSFNSGGTTTHRYFVNHVVAGAHLTQDVPPRFDRIDVRFSHLEEWLGHYPFDSPAAAHGWKRDEPTVLTHAHPPRSCANLSDQVRISTTSTLSQNPASPWRYDSRHSAYFSIEVLNPLSLWELYSELVTPLRDLVALGLGRAVAVTDIQAYSREATFCPPGGKLFKVPLTITSPLFQRRGAPSASTKHDRSAWIHPVHMLLPGAELLAQFDQHIPAWFWLRRRFETVCELYFATLYSPVMYLEHQFLNMAQAAETFHRQRYAGAYMGKSEAKALCKAVRKAIPTTIVPDVRKKIVDKLSHLHEYTLRDRLSELTSSCDPLLNWVDPSFDAQAFNDRVRTTRNYLTHWVPKLGAKAAKGVDLIRLTRRLRTMLTICLLRELGLKLEPLHVWKERLCRYEGISS
jgi:hypothetical protein